MEGLKFHLSIIRIMDLYEGLRFHLYYINYRFVWGVGIPIFTIQIYHLYERLRFQSYHYTNLCIYMEGLKLLILTITQVTGLYDGGLKSHLSIIRIYGSV